MQTAPVGSFAVTTIEPRDGAQDVAPDTRVSVRFSAAVDPASAANAAIVLSGPEGTVEGRTEVQADRLVFAPGEPLALDGRYQLQVASALRDTAGRALSAPAPVSFQVRAGQWSSPVLIDRSASGVPVELRFARSSRGTVFAVWRSFDGVRHNLWANVYDLVGNRWGQATLLERIDDDIAEFKAAADGRGNAFVIFSSRPPGVEDPSEGQAAVVRYDAGSQAWSLPHSFGRGWLTDIAADQDGNALAIWISSVVSFYEAATGRWSDPRGVEVNTTGTGSSSVPAIAMSPGGNGVAIWRNERISASIVGGNDFIGATQSWRYPTQPDFFGIQGGVPNSFVYGLNQTFQISPDNRGNFFMAWEQLIVEPDLGEVRLLVTRHTPGAGWSSPTVLRSPDSSKQVRLQAARVDRNGNALVTWTETDAARTVLRALRFDDVSQRWSAPQVLDAAVGGGANQVDLDFDRCGNATLVWQQHEGGQVTEGVRTNIASARYLIRGDTFTPATLIESDPGNASSPRVAHTCGRTVAAWIQTEGALTRVKAIVRQ